MFGGQLAQWWQSLTPKPYPTVSTIMTDGITDFPSFFQLRKEDESGDVTRDWKFAAMVVDRLCLIIFTLFTIIATLAVLFSAPHFLVS